MIFFALLDPSTVLIILKGLRSFSLPDCEIDDQGAHYFADALRENQVKDKLVLAFAYLYYAI